MTTTETIETLRNFNRWRRGDDGIEQPEPALIGLAIENACLGLEYFRWKVDELESAVEDFIIGNLHLADGDNCTLKPLKDLIKFELPNEEI